MKLICYCGKEDERVPYYSQVHYDCNQAIVYAICMHGIVCINTAPEVENTIAILEDLKISVQNEICGFEPCGRELLRIQALEKAIETLKKEIK